MDSIINRGRASSLVDIEVGWVHPKIAKQSPEQRARIFDGIAANYEKEASQSSDPEQAKDRHERAEHLRALAQRMRDEQRVLA